MARRGANSLKAAIIACLLVSYTAFASSRGQETPEQIVERVKKAMQKRWDLARGGIRHALALDATSAEAHFIAAQVYWHEGARSMAIESLDRAIEIQPVYPEAHLLLSQCLVEDGKRERARAEANIAIAQGASLYPAYRLLAEIELAKGDFDAAIAALETAVSFLPGGDAEEVAKAREQNEKSRELVEKLRRFAVIEAAQKTSDIVRPVLVNLAHPSYTAEARERKIQGAVSMAILVTEDGDVDSVMLFCGLGHGLDEQAVEAARKLKFSPATQSGRPISYWTKLAIEFNLR